MRRPWQPARDAFLKRDGNRRRVSTFPRLFGSPPRLFKDAPPRDLSFLDFKPDATFFSCKKKKKLSIVEFFLYLILNQSIRTESILSVFISPESVVCSVKSANFVDWDEK